MEQVRKLFQQDRFVKMIGVELVELREGYAKSVVTVVDDHLNGKDFTQGGVVFTLADYTMAAAANTHGQLALTATSGITYFKPSGLGDVLTAEAEELSCGRKMSHYRVDVRNQRNELIAVFQGSCSNISQ
jgi:acyl-CoA thioesterase